MKTKPPCEGLETLPVIAHVTASTQAVMGAEALYQKATTPDEKKTLRPPGARSKPGICKSKRNFNGRNVTDAAGPCLNFRLVFQSTTFYERTLTLAPSFYERSWRGLSPYQLPPTRELGRRQGDCRRRVRRDIKPDSRVDRIP